MTFLSPLSSPLPSVGETTEVSVPAPSWFRGPQGTVTRVHVEYERDYLPASGDTEAQKSGLRYEAKVQDALIALPLRYFPTPTIAFRDEAGPHVAIPDGLYLQDQLITIVEIKISHMPDAWWQLERKYKPILQVWRPNARIQCLEIVRTFDSAVPFPCKFEFIPSLEAFLNFVSGRGQHPFGVFQWRP